MIKMKDIILRQDKVTDYNTVNTFINQMKKYINSSFKHRRIIIIDYDEIKINSKRYTGI